MNRLACLAVCIASIWPGVEYRAHLAHAESLGLGRTEYDLVELKAQH